MKAHYSRYTIEMVERICGSPKDRLLQAWQWMAETAAPDRAMTSMYALGWTQHSEASQNIRTMAIVQLLLGNTEDIAYFEIEGTGGQVKA